MMPRNTLSLALIAVVFAGCASLKNLADVKKPTAEVQRMRFSDVDFEKIGLVFDVAVDNPNPVAVSIAELDYRFSLDGRDMLDGSKTDALRVSARGSQTTEIPVNIDFADVAALAGSLEGRDSIPYAFAATLQLDLPVLGRTPVPIEFAGELPVIRPPTVSVIGVEKTRLNFSGAGLLLRLAVDNPNTFSLMLNQFQYTFGVNERTWIESRLSGSTPIQGKGAAALEIPIEVSFLKIGMTAYQILKGSESADYNLTGSMNLDSSLPFLKDVKHEVKKSGPLSIR